MIAACFSDTAAPRRERRRLTVAGSTVDLAVAAVNDADAPVAAAARELAEALAATRLAADRRELRIASLAPSGRPVLFVAGRAAGIAVSVSHLEGLVAAAVAASPGVGIDLVDPAAAGRGLDFWLTPEELALEPDEGLLRARLWAAKEAAYKAAGLDEELRPRTVAIESLGPHAFTWSASSGFAGAAGAGRFLAAGRHVVAVAVATVRHSCPSDSPAAPSLAGAAASTPLEFVRA